MENLIWHLIDELRKTDHIHIIGPQGSGNYLPKENTSAHEIKIHPLYAFLFNGLIKSLATAVRYRPQKIIAGSGLTAPLAWLASKAVGARSIVYLHGLDIETKHPLYRFFWFPFLRRFDVVLVNSHFTYQLAQQIGIAASRMHILHPGVSLPQTLPHRSANFREQHDLLDHPMLLYVGRITPRKGLLSFVRSIFPAIVKQRSDVRLVIIGQEPSNALNFKAGELALIHQSLQENGLEKKVVWLPETTWHNNEKELSAIFFTADVLIFPVQDIPGDHEGFGMVALEAAAHGTPTVAFAAGGVVDAISDNYSGRLIKTGDHQEFANAVMQLISKSIHDINAENCQNFASKFTWTNFGEKLQEILNGGEPHKIDK